MARHSGFAMRVDRWPMSFGRAMDGGAEAYPPLAFGLFLSAVEANLWATSEFKR